MLVFEERWKGAYPRKNLSVQSREQTNSTHMWRWIWESNLSHIGGRWVLSPLCHPCTPGNCVIFACALAQNVKKFKCNDKVTCIAYLSSSHDARGPKLCRKAIPSLPDYGSLKLHRKPGTQSPKVSVKELVGFASSWLQLFCQVAKQHKGIAPKVKCILN